MRRHLLKPGRLWVCSGCCDRDRLTISLGWPGLLSGRGLDQPECVVVNRSATPKGLRKLLLCLLVRKDPDLQSVFWGSCCHSKASVLRSASSCPARHYSQGRPLSTPHYRRGRHSTTDLKAHLICVAKCRKSVFCQEGLETIKEAMNSVADKMEFKILEFNGEGDHVHVLLEYPPKLSVSTLVKHLKGVSSRAYRKAGHPCPSKDHLWSPSYFSVSVAGAPLDVLKAYIQNQKTPS